MTSGAFRTYVSAGESAGLPQRYKDTKRHAESPREDFGRYRLGERALSRSRVTRVRSEEAGTSTSKAGMSFRFRMIALAAARSIKDSGLGSKFERRGGVGLPRIPSFADTDPWNKAEMRPGINRYRSYVVQARIDSKHRNAALTAARRGVIITSFWTISCCLYSRWNAFYSRKSCCPSTSSRNATSR